MKRKDRIGKHIVQQSNDCMLAAWCMAGGYRYSKSRQERYGRWHNVNKLLGDGADTVGEIMDRPFKRYHDDYIAAFEEANPRRRPRTMMAKPEFKGNGTLNMWSVGGICHSVAVIDTPQGHIIKDPSDSDGHIYTSYAEYKRINHTRPTLVTFVEVT